MLQSTNCELIKNQRKAKYGIVGSWHKKSGWTTVSMIPIWTNHFFCVVDCLERLVSVGLLDFLVYKQSPRNPCSLIPSQLYLFHYQFTFHNTVVPRETA